MIDFLVDVDWGALSGGQGGQGSGVSVVGNRVAVAPWGAALEARFPRGRVGFVGYTAGGRHLRPEQCPRELVDENARTFVVGAMRGFPVVAGGLERVSVVSKVWVVVVGYGGG